MVKKWQDLHLQLREQFAAAFVQLSVVTTWMSVNKQLLLCCAIAQQNILLIWKTTKKESCYWKRFGKAS